MKFAFTQNGVGWPVDCLDDPEAPPIASRLADAVRRAQTVWDAATPAEQEEFWSWLCPEPQPRRRR
jgi:hypothetical protein